MMASVTTGICGEGLDTCYSAACVSQTRDQQRFTISEVAADWHKPVVPQRIMWPSVPAPADNWTHCAASRHTVAPISHTRPSPRSRPAEGRRLSWPEHTVG